MKRKAGLATSSDMVREPYTIMDGAMRCSGVTTPNIGANVSDGCGQPAQSRTQAEAGMGKPAAHSRDREGNACHSYRQDRRRLERLVDKLRRLSEPARDLGRNVALVVAQIPQQAGLVENG